MRRLARILLPILFVVIGVAAVRGGLGIPQNPFGGLFLLIATTALTVTALLHAGGGDE